MEINDKNLAAFNKTVEAEKERLADQTKDFSKAMIRIGQMFEKFGNDVKEGKTSPKMAFLFCTGNVIDNLAEQLAALSDTEGSVKALAYATERLLNEKGE